MKVKVRALAGLRHILGRELLVELAEGSRIEDLLEVLCEDHQNLRQAIFGDLGLKDEVNILVNGKNIASKEGLKTALFDGDLMAMFPAAIGG